uniref:C2H2-type domain-containing protein n=1 Tax=Parastrongyloides trichosuri TaxID=131310 RepID=A0A0N5A6P7_PARTI
MTLIRCPPSKDEFIIKYQGKTYCGEYENIKNVLKAFDLNIPIMHFPYLCDQDGCNSYPTEKRRKDKFFTFKELAMFSEEDFSKYDAEVTKERKETVDNNEDEDDNASKNKKVNSSIKILENLLNDFATPSSSKKTSFLHKFHQQLLQEHAQACSSKEAKSKLFMTGSNESKSTDIHHLSVESIDDKELDDASSDREQCSEENLVVKEEMTTHEDEDKCLNVEKAVCPILPPQKQPLLKEKLLELPCNDFGEGSSINFNKLRHHVKKNDMINEFIENTEFIITSPHDLNSTEQFVFGSNTNKNTFVKNIYKCVFKDYCGFSTHYRINFEKHLESHSTIESIFKCNSCGLTFQEQNFLIEHRLRYCLKILDQNNFQPMFVLNYRSEFLNLVNYYDLLTCRYSNICSFVCNTKKELKCHTNEVHVFENFNYNCLKCNAKFMDKISLTIHSKNYCWRTMEMLIQSKRLMKCSAENCDFTSISVPEWHIHLTSHAYLGDVTPYECSKCYCYLSSDVTLNEHEKFFCSTIRPKYIDYVDDDCC